jgi:hypothetical protein
VAGVTPLARRQPALGQLGDPGPRHRYRGRDGPGAYLVASLHQAGWTVIAHIHPGHLASHGVARAAGLSPSGDVHDGEVRWIVSG